MNSIICKRHGHPIAMKLGGGECVCSPAECLSPPVASAETPALCGIEPAYRAACSDYHELGCTADRCVMDGGKCEHPQRNRVRAALAAALADRPEARKVMAQAMWLSWDRDIDVVAAAALAALRQLFLGPAE